MADGGHRLGERRDTRHDLGASRDVLAHDKCPGAVELARLREDRIGHPDLADVVEESGGPERAELPRGQAQLAFDRERHTAYALRVAGRVRVAGLDRSGQLTPGDRDRVASTT